MQLMKVCPRCRGEGEMRIPPYGFMKDSKWILENHWSASIEGGAVFKVVGDCKPCGGSGYLKVAS